MDTGGTDRRHRARSQSLGKAHRCRHPLGYSHSRPEEKDALFIGLLRLHIAHLIKPLGHVELAGALHRLTLQPFARRLQNDIQHARTLLEAAPVGEMEKASAMGGLVGGIVTRAGPVTNADVAPIDQETLARLNLRPVFVGGGLNAISFKQPLTQSLKLCVPGWLMRCVRMNLPGLTALAAGSSRSARNDASLAAPETAAPDTCIMGKRPITSHKVLKIRHRLPDEASPNTIWTA